MSSFPRVVGLVTESGSWGVSWGGEGLLGQDLGGVWGLAGLRRVIRWR